MVEYNAQNMNIAGFNIYKTIRNEVNSQATASLSDTIRRQLNNDVKDGYSIKKGSISVSFYNTDNILGLNKVKVDPSLENISVELEDAVFNDMNYKKIKPQYKTNKSLLQLIEIKGKIMIGGELAKHPGYVVIKGPSNSPISKKRKIEIQKTITKAYQKYLDTDDANELNTLLDGLEKEIVNEIKPKWYRNDSRINDIILTSFDDVIGPVTLSGKKKFNLIKKDLNNLMITDDLTTVIKWGGKYMHYVNFNVEPEINRDYIRGSNLRYGLIIVTDGPELSNDKINTIKQEYKQALTTHDTLVKETINNKLTQTMNQKEVLLEEDIKEITKQVKQKFRHN